MKYLYGFIFLLISLFCSSMLFSQTSNTRSEQILKRHRELKSSETVSVAKKQNYAIKADLKIYSNYNRPNNLKYLDLLPRTYQEFDVYDKSTVRDLYKKFKNKKYAETQSLEDDFYRDDPIYDFDLNIFKYFIPQGYRDWIWGGQNRDEFYPVPMTEMFAYLNSLELELNLELKGCEADSLYDCREYYNEITEPVEFELTCSLWGEDYREKKAKFDRDDSGYWSNTLPDKISEYIGLNATPIVVKSHLDKIENLKIPLGDLFARDLEIFYCAHYDAPKDLSFSLYCAIGVKDEVPPYDFEIFKSSKVRRNYCAIASHSKYLDDSKKEPFACANFQASFFDEREYKVLNAETASIKSEFSKNDDIDRIYFKLFKDVKDNTILSFENDASLLNLVVKQFNRAYEKGYKQSTNGKYYSFGYRNGDPYK